MKQFVFPWCGTAINKADDDKSKAQCPKCSKSALPQQNIPKSVENGEKTTCPTTKKSFFSNILHNTFAKTLFVEVTRCKSCGHFMPIPKTKGKVWTTLCPKCGGDCTVEKISRSQKTYVCDLCGKYFSQKKLDKHFIKTAKLASGV